MPESKRHSKQLLERAELCSDSEHPAAVWYREDIPRLLEQYEGLREDYERRSELWEKRGRRIAGLLEQLEVKQRELDEEVERAIENGRLAKRLHEQLEALDRVRKAASAYYVTSNRDNRFALGDALRDASSASSDASRSSESSPAKSLRGDDLEGASPANQLKVYRTALEMIRDKRDEAGNLITGREAEAIAFAALESNQESERS